MVDFERHATEGVPVNLLATAVIGFLAGIVCYLVGKSGHKSVMWLAGGLAFVVGWGFNIGAEAAKYEPVTQTYTHCTPRIPPSPPLCIDYETQGPPAPPPREPFMIRAVKGFGATFLEAPAAALGIVMAIGIAKLFGAKGPAPPLGFTAWDDTTPDDS